jgi:pyruvate dehydrogenase E2 component (dihydrolipoamide acetyltransferase)
VAKEIVMPALEMAQEAGTLVRWLQPEGASVRKGDPLMEIETDKAVMEIEAPDTGILANLSARPGDSVPVGQVIGLLLTEQEHARSAEPAEAGKGTPSDASPELSTKAPGAATPTHPPEPVSSGISRTDAVTPRLSPASPKARRLAAENRIDLSGLSGSGVEGGVVTADLKALLTRPQIAQGESEYVAVPATRMRALISERLQRSYQEAPHIGLTLSIDMGEVLKLIQIWNKRAARVPLKVTAVLAKAIAASLVEFPRLNAHLVDGEIREFNTVHLGFAVALEDGLLVPTLRNAERKSLRAIQSELDDLFARARAGRLRLDEIKGSTFTVSNLGMFGIEQFSAILNPPEVGILSVGVIKDSPAVVGGQIVARPLMQATINADHRAVDGASAARFLNGVKQRLEDPGFSATELAEAGA